MGSQFIEQIKHAQLIAEPTIIDVQDVAKALLSDLGPHWEKSLVREFSDLNSIRGYSEHPLFWTAKDCLMAINRFNAAYRGPSDLSAFKSWDLPKQNAQLFIDNDTLYYFKGGVRIMLAHSYGGGFGKSPYTCSLCSSLEYWFQSQFGYFEFSKHFANKMTHSKSMDSAQKRLAVIAEIIATRCSV